MRGLARLKGCAYIARESRDHAKAGNLNHALKQTSGELIAVFDTDHVPTSAFLRETVGFFDNQRVAIVQTPHHFYNPDIFQRNLRLERELNNEQALFFRALQPGRDAHNSAFFAGSSGVFRRRPLMEIGGFQTDTITEDIHTSMLVHAKGYESRFLNKVLAAGLMPETFGGYLKQRTRWAIGCIQMFLKCNPMTVRGLTWSQRIDYLGSVYYFFHGIPRVICLSAPRAALLLGVSPVHATVGELVHLFGSYFFATLVMMRTVGSGTRNAFWADVYETAMCFSLSNAPIATMLRPRKPRAFVVTPKGEKLEKRGIKEAVTVMRLLMTSDGASFDGRYYKFKDVELYPKPLQKHIPVYVGGNNPNNIARTVKSLIKAGAAAMHMEDQVGAKRCGHRPNKELVSRQEMVDRVKAAVDAKTDAQFVVMARTDALAVEGLQAAIDRARACVEAGADMIFPEAITELAMYREFADAVKVPILANITEFGKTPLFTVEELAGAGVAIVLYPLSAFRAMNAAALRVYEAIRKDGTQKGVVEQMQTREELYDFLDYHAYERKLDELFARDKKK